MILLFFLFGLALGAVTPPVEQNATLQRGACPDFWFSFNGRCYKYVSTRMTWADAELHCVSERANLVSIHSEEEQNYITTLIKNFDPAEGPTWIGLSDTQKEDGWMWSDGSAVNYSFWYTGEPNNQGGNEDCVHTNLRESPKWNDELCSDNLASVCELRPACP